MDQYHPGAANLVLCHNARMPAIWISGMDIKAGFYRAATHGGQVKPFLTIRLSVVMKIYGGKELICRTEERFILTGPWLQMEDQV